MAGPGFNDPIMMAQMQADRAAAIEAKKKPTAPTYQFWQNPDTGVLQDQFQQKYGSDITPDTTAINKLQENALSTGPSSWAQAQSAAQKLQTKGLFDQAQQQGASANASAQNSLASKFGLSKAAQERLAVQNQRNTQGALQNVGFQGAQAQAAIGAQDAANKQNMLSNLPGQQNSLAQLQLANRQASLGQGNINIANSLNQNALQNASKLENYKQQMAAWGADKNADSMQAQSGGGKK